MRRARTYTLPAFPESNRHTDDAREERINVLNALLNTALAEGANNEFRRLQREIKAAVLSRSPAQIARMRGLAAGDNA